MSLPVMDSTPLDSTIPSHPPWTVPLPLDSNMVGILLECFLGQNNVESCYMYPKTAKADTPLSLVAHRAILLV